MEKKLEKKFQTELSKFKEASEKMEEEISKHLGAAETELKAAVKVSEKYGLPYVFPMSFLMQTYTPKSCEKKWSKLVSQVEKLDPEEINSLKLDVDAEETLESLTYDIEWGWEHSAVC